MIIAVKMQSSEFSRILNFAALELLFIVAVAVLFVCLILYYKYDWRVLTMPGHNIHVYYNMVIK